MARPPLRRPNSSSHPLCGGCLTDGLLLEDFFSRQIEARIGGGEHIAADFVKSAGGEREYGLQTRIHQPDVRYTLTVVLFQFLHDASHTVVFRQYLDRDERC